MKVTPKELTPASNNVDYPPSPTPGPRRGRPLPANHDMPVFDSPPSPIEDSKNFFSSMMAASRAKAATQAGTDSTAGGLGASTAGKLKGKDKSLKRKWVSGAIGSGQDYLQKIKIMNIGRYRHYTGIR